MQPSRPLKDAGIDLDNEDRSRIGAVIGSAAGDQAYLEEATARFIKMGPGSVNPLTVPRVITNMPVCNVSMVLGIHGPNLGVSAACTTGTHSIGIALGITARGYGRCDISRRCRVDHHAPGP